MIHAVYWLPVVLVWATFGYMIRQIIVIRRRRRKLDRTLTLTELADESDLTPIQIQVALDAATAVFIQRAEEMRRANRAR